MEHTNIILGTRFNRSKLHLNQKGTTLLASNFINTFKRVQFENKDEVSNDNVTIIEINSGISTVGRSENLQGKNKSRALSMIFSASKPETSLKSLKIKNINRIIFGQYNINTLTNKFGQLHEFCKDNLDILLITQTKLESSFPSAQFHIPGYCSPYRLDRNSHGGGILLYIRKPVEETMSDFMELYENVSPCVYML